MADTIGLRGLHLSCVIGTETTERSRPQRLELDVEVELDVAGAARADDLEQTVDYLHMAERLRALAARGRFQLIEALAASAAQELLNCWPAIAAVRLEVRKPGALEAADHSFCRLERRR